jgi:uncharacterized protein
VKRRLLLSLTPALLASALLPSLARSASRALLFPASEVAPLEAPADFVRHALTAADGVPVHALELPAPPGARTVVHFHNNRETAETPADLARSLRALGVGVLLVEYRGYGASRGVAPSSEAGLYLDAEAALDLLAARGVGPDRVVLWGTSLGTGVAAEMARRGRGARLVLVTPYTSVPDIVTGVAPFVPARALVSDHFDTLSKARDIRMPTLIVHGDADEIVPYAMGERLSREIQGARLLRIEGGRHGDLFMREGRRLLAEIAAPDGQPR